MAKILEYISLNYTWFLVGAIIIVLAIIGHYAEKSNFGQEKSDTSTEDKNKNKNKKIDLDKTTLNELISKEDNIDDNENINAQEIFNENSLEDIPSMDEKDNSDISFQNTENNSNESISNETVSNDLNELNDNLFDQTIEPNDKINTEILEVDSNDVQLGEPISNEVNLTEDNVNANEILNSVSNETPIENINNEITNTSQDDSTKNMDLIEEQFENFDKQFETIIPKKDLGEEFIDNVDDISLDQTQTINTEDIPDLDDVDLPEIRDVNISDNDIWKF